MEKRRENRIGICQRVIYRTADMKVEGDTSMDEDSALLEDTELLADELPSKIVKKQSKDSLK